MVKVVICGTASTSIHLANSPIFANPEWQIYSCNGAFHTLNRIDLHFELHDIDYLRNDVKPDPTYFDFLKDIGAKAILNREYSEFPEATTYPIQKICDFVNAKYFNNTISYMIAYSMWLFGDKLTDIALVGVDMAGKTEYAHQRPCCEFYVGMAKGKGIRIHLPEGTPLLNSSHLYGFEKLPNYMVSSRNKLKELEELTKNTKILKEQADRNHHYTEGMRDMLETITDLHQ